MYLVCSENQRKKKRGAYHINRNYEVAIRRARVIAARQKRRMYVIVAYKACLSV